MKATRAVEALFVSAALYDGALGAIFLIAPGPDFQWANVTPPNHWAYVQFPAALLIIFGLMFAAIARDPPGSRSLIVYGILLKLSYCGIASWHWFTAGIPGLWKPFAVIDLVMAVLFAWSYRALGEGPGGASSRSDPSTATLQPKDGGTDPAPTGKSPPMAWYSVGGGSVPRILDSVAVVTPT
jgi:hypothetical protein